MRIYISLVAMGLSLFVTSELLAQADFFWSISTDNVVNNDSVDLFPGNAPEYSAYLYYSPSGPSNSELTTGAFLDLEISFGFGIEFVGAETFDFPITIANSVADTRWGSTVSTGTVFDNFINELGAFTITEGTGIINDNGVDGPFLDGGYNADADAFLFARVDFRTVSAGGIATVTVSAGSGLVVNGGFDCGTMALDPVFGELSITTPLGVGTDGRRPNNKSDGPPESGGLLGDVNGDGKITLLDVQPFVDLIANLEFSLAADINQDGAVNLLDVSGFVALLTQPLVGDVNCDGCINLLDVPCFLGTLVNPANNPPCNFETIDINGDGNIDLLDVAPLSQILLDQE